MGVSRQQAAENRSAIVAAAERLFRARGVDAVGLTELMKAAAFTQGGFYNHFKSKDALVAAVMEKAMQDRADSPAYPLPQQVARYLSAAHRDDVDAGCPLMRRGWAPTRAQAMRAASPRISTGSPNAWPRHTRRGIRPAGATRSRRSARWSARCCCRARSPMSTRRSPMKSVKRGARRSPIQATERPSRPDSRRGEHRRASWHLARRVPQAARAERRVPRVELRAP